MFKRGPTSRLLTYSSIRFFSQFSGAELSFILTNEYFASQILKPIIFFLSLTHTAGRSQYIQQPSLARNLSQCLYS